MNCSFIKTLTCRDGNEEIFLCLQVRKLTYLLSGLIFFGFPSSVTSHSGEMLKTLSGWTDCSGLDSRGRLRSKMVLGRWPWQWSQCILADIIQRLGKLEPKRKVLVGVSRGLPKGRVCRRQWSGGNSKAWEAVVKRRARILETWRWR